MTRPQNPHEPQGAPPAWLEEFSRDIQQALTVTDVDDGLFPDLPEGEPFNDKLGQVQATYLKRQKRRDALPRP